MKKNNINQYYNATENSEVRSDLVLAVQKIEDLKLPKIAIDSGCGAGSDIEYLLKHDFIVHAFDIEEEAISRCKLRFKNIKKVFLSQESFSSFVYPEASLVVADASLFYCPKNEFSAVWKNINKCLMPSGVFCGSFLGTEDSMADPKYDKDAFWSDILVFDDAKEVKALFKDYEIDHFTEHKSSGLNSQGELHHWHVFCVVATKQLQITGYN